MKILRNLILELAEHLNIRTTGKWLVYGILIGVVAGLADRVLVMYGGLIIEEAPTKSLYDNPTHPYTIGLMESLPRTDRQRARRLTSIDGIPPVLMESPNFCPFAPRCKFVVPRCRNERPAQTARGEQSHRVACFVDPQTGREYE